MTSAHSEISSSHTSGVENVVKYGRDVRIAPANRLPLPGETITKRVFAKSISDYVIDEATGCWVWQKSKTKLGYATATGFKPYRAYYQRAHPGEDIDGLDIHHKCHNPACVNPAHLEPIDRKTHLRRHKRSESALTEEDVIAIRSSQKSCYELAEQYGVTHEAIRLIWRGHGWYDVGSLEKPMRDCGWCGEKLPQTKRRNAMYCDADCRARAQRAKKYKPDPSRWTTTAKPQKRS